MQSFLPLFTSFVIALMMIPSLVKIARQKNIFDEPGTRKMHTARTPLLGGFALFTGTVISYLFWSGHGFQLQHLFVLVSLIILFVTGFIDDLQPLVPAVKLFMQIVAATITVMFSGISITSLHGLFDIHSIAGLVSILVSVFFILVIVNAFNFIDGIDGLAASLGILSSAVFGFLFLALNDYVFSTLSFSLCGSLIAFLVFNVTPAKIFMGDTGTLITGFILSLLAIQLTESTRTNPSAFQFLNFLSAPVIALALLIIPVTDFIRVTAVRILNRKSPVKADNNHIHHLLVSIGLNHMEATTLLIAINLCFIGSVFMFSRINQSLLFFSILATALLLSQVPYFLLRRNRGKITS